MTQIGISNPGPAWASLSELQRAEWRTRRAAAAGTLLLILGLVAGVMLLDRLMPTSRPAAEQAMALPYTD